MRRVLLASAALVCALGGGALADTAGGRPLLDQGRPDEAAAAFDDPAWRGVAFYRAGRFRAAVDAFRQAGDPASLYNLGNALARLDDYEGAVKAYDAALAREPENADARANRELVLRLKGPSRPDAKPGAGGAEADATRSVGDERDPADEDNAAAPSLGDGAAGQHGAASDSATQGHNQTQQRAAAQTPKADQKPGTAKGSVSDTEGIGRTGQGPAPAVPSRNEALSGRKPATPESRQASEQWLATIPDDPGRFLRARLAFEQSRREAAGIAVPPGADPW